MNVPLSIASQCQPPWVPTHSLTYTSLATEVARGDWKYEIPPEWRWELLVTILDSVGYQFSSIEWWHAQTQVRISEDLLIAGFLWSSDEDKHAASEV